MTELTDSLVEPFIDLAQAINTRAERRVDKEQIAEFRRAGDKDTVLRSALALVNTRLVDRILDEPEWAARLELDLTSRLGYDLWLT
jgi:hypothetical protein